MTTRYAKSIDNTAFYQFCSEVYQMLFERGICISNASDIRTDPTLLQISSRLYADNLDIIMEQDVERSLVVSLMIMMMSIDTLYAITVRQKRGDGNRFIARQQCIS